METSPILTELSPSSTGGTDPHDGGGGDGHTKNDIVFVTNGVERMFVDNTGYIEMTSNSTFRVPQGTVSTKTRYFRYRSQPRLYVSILITTFLKSY